MKKKNQKSKKPDKARPVPRERKREDAGALAEFSDEYNDFYVDEIELSRVKEREARAAAKESKRSERKPVSPLRRRLTRIISSVAIVGVILIVGVVLSLTVLFKTQRYEVIGNNLYLESDIISTCGISEGENIFLAPKRPAEERIMRRFPYIDSARVSFGIPDTIRIEITQATEGYLIKVSDTEYLIISTKGRILNRIADRTGYDLPVFIGPTPKSGELGDYVSYDDGDILDVIDSITQVFTDNGYQGITEINAVDQANLTFTYDNRIRVKLGLPEDLSYKIRTAMTIIRDNIDVNPDSKAQGVLDVSRCNVTKRSYYNEQDISETQAPTQDPSEASTEPVSSDDSGYGESDNSGNTGEYEWTEDYSGDYDGSGDYYEWSDVGSDGGYYE